MQSEHLQSLTSITVVVANLSTSIICEHLAQKYPRSFNCLKSNPTLWFQYNMTQHMNFVAHTKFTLNLKGYSSNFLTPGTHFYRTDPQPMGQQGKNVTQDQLTAGQIATI